MDTPSFIIFMSNKLKFRRFRDKFHKLSSFMGTPPSTFSTVKIKYVDICLVYNRLKNECPYELKPNREEKKNRWPSL